MKSSVLKLSGTLAVRWRFERSDAHERGEWCYHRARVICELRFEAQQLHVTHVPNYVHVARRSVQTTHDQGEAVEVEVGQKLFQPIWPEIQPRRKSSRRSSDTADMMLAHARDALNWRVGTNWSLCIGFQEDYDSSSMSKSKQQVDECGYNDSQKHTVVDMRGKPIVSE